MSMDAADEADRETHDFMNVNSFSQLPFLRPKDRDKPALRLFGFDFSQPHPSAAGHDSSSSSKADGDAETTARRFECHYCCRNFPTSQALGGHQNAHKRERQNAKRAHIPSPVDAHLYGLLNYSSYPPSTTWNTSPINGSRVFTAHKTMPFAAAQQPINGSPLGVWKIPASVHTTSLDRDRSTSSMSRPLPSFAGDDQLKHHHVSQTRFVYQPKPGTVQDHVSLDLRL